MHASTHRGGVGTPLEGTYFQAKLGNARCVQSLDDSLNSAIHITYRISLRSSSLREPRYPSTGVVLKGLWGADDRRPPKAADDCPHTWGGAEGGTARRHATRGARPPERRERSHARPHAHAPPTRTSSGEDAREGARGGRPQRGTAGGPKAKVRTGFGMDTGNDPSAGSPTETLLRLLLPLNNKVWTASRSVASGEPNASPQSGGLTGSFNR